MTIRLRALEAQDWNGVKRIYEEAIQQGDATFEITAPEWEDWHSNHLPCCRLVVEQDDQITGWAALSPISERCVYEGVAEVSVYVTTMHQKKGIGKALLMALIEASEQAGIWTLQAGIFPENKASLTLHKSCGFRVVGVRERIGLMYGRWRDVTLLERRSPII